MKTRFTCLIFSLMICTFFNPTSTVAFGETEPTLEASHIQDLGLCIESFLKAKEKGLCKMEMEQAPSEDYTIEEKYIQQAEYDYKWNHVKRAVYATFIYGPLFLIPSATIFLYRKILAGETISPMQSAQIVASYVSGSYLLAGGLRETVEGFIRMSKSLIEQGINEIYAKVSGHEAPKTWNAEIQINAAKLKYQDLRDKLPEAHQIAIEDQFQKLTAQHIDHSMNRISLLPSKDDGVRKSVTIALKSIERILSIPQTLKPVKINEEKLSELVSNYPEAVQAKLKNFANAISYWSNPDQKLASRPFREVLYLQGASGTGKTYFAERFADVFDTGLPLIRISLEDVSDLKDLIGQVASRFDDQEKKVSKLSYALSNLPPEKRYKNAIIVLDEADKFLNSDKASEIRGYLTKEIFNLSTKKLKLHDLGVEVDISGYHFILIGNTPIYDASNAFMDRMTVVKFGAFAEDKRIKIACGEFGKGMSQLSHVPPSDAYLKAILEGVHRDQTQKPGVRTLLRTIGEFVDHLSNPENIKIAFPFNERLEANAQIYSDPYSQYEMTMQKFERVKPLLSVSMQKSIGNHLDKITKGKLLNEALRPNNNEDKKMLDTYLQNLNAMMRFSNDVRNLATDETRINTELDKLLRLYPEEVRDPIRDLVQLHIAASQKGISHRDLSKNIVYLWGEPGTGKSYLAQGLAKALNLSLIELDFKGGKFSELFGEGYFDFMLSSPSKFSLFTQTFLNFDGKTPEKNAVVYINEIDKILNSRSGESDHIKTILLDILDPDKKEFELRDLRAGIDLTRYLFVLVGNERILNSSKSSALDDRMTLIEFKGFSLESKQEIARNYFDSLVQSSDLKVSKEETSVVDALIEYSHVQKHQVSLRTPFKIIDLYANWLVKREGSFDHRAKLDLFSKDK